MNKNNLKEKLNSLMYVNAKNGKIFFSLNDVLKTFNLKNDKEMFEIVKSIKKEFVNISYPVKNIMQFQKKDKIIYDTYLSKTGLAFVLAAFSKSEKYLNKKELLSELSKLCIEKDYVFYPEKRLLLRQDYTETTKGLRSRIKKIYVNDDYVSISERLNTLYHTIICAYYNVDNSNHLNIYKFNDKNKKYLDYISARELKDLHEIQNIMLYKLSQKSSQDYLQTAKHEALIKRKQFIADYGVTPLDYSVHTNKPLTMLKKFNKLREKLSLDEKSLINEIDIFNK